MPTLFVSNTCPNPSALQNKLNNEISNCYHWRNDNKLTLNPAKYDSLAISPTSKRIFRLYKIIPQLKLEKTPHIDYYRF